MNLFLFCFLHLALINQSNKIPECYSEFSIPYGNYSLAVSKVYPEGLKNNSARCDKKWKNFKLADFREINYLDQLSQDSIKVEIYKAKEVGFVDCYITGLLQHINLNINTKWNTALNIFQIKGINIYDVTPSKVTESQRGHFFLFSLDSKTLICITTSPTKKTESGIELLSHAESFVRLFVDHINSCEN